MDLDISVEMPDFEMPDLDLGADIDFSLPEIDITSEGLTYDGSFEWTATDQAGFDAAVAEHASTSEGEYSWTPSPYSHNKALSESYLAYEDKSGTVPLSESEVFENIFSDPEELSQGVWLSDVDTGIGPALSPRLEESRLAAIKLLAAELGLSVEDVQLKRGDEIVTDTILRTYPLDELPEEPYKIDDEQYMCERTVITAEEARRISAARKLAVEVGEDELRPDVGQIIRKSVEHLQSNDPVLRIEIEKPRDDKEAVAVSARKYDSAIEIPERYNHVVDEPEEDVYLVRMDDLNDKELPYIEHVARDLEGYDVEGYKYKGESIDGETTYDAVLEVA